MEEFLKKLPVTNVDIQLYNYDLQSKENRAHTVYDIEKINGLDLSRLIVCDNAKGRLILLNNSEDYGIPGRLVFRNGKKEMEVQVMLNPYSDYIAYKDLVTGREVVEKIEQFEMVNNLIKIDINQWLI